MTKRFSLTAEPIAGCTLLLGAVLYNFHNYSICHFILVGCQQESTVHPEQKYCLQLLSRAERGKCLLTGTAFLTVNSPRAFKGIKPGSICRINALISMLKWLIFLFPDVSEGC